jgi:hypothetical protein
MTTRRANARPLQLLRRRASWVSPASLGRVVPEKHEGPIWRWNAGALVNDSASKDVR